MKTRGEQLSPVECPGGGFMGKNPTIIPQKFVDHSSFRRILDEDIVDIFSIAYSERRYGSHERSFWIYKV